MGYLRYNRVIPQSITASAGSFALAGQNATLTQGTSGVITGHNGGRMQTNTNSLAVGDYPFLNLMKEAGFWGAADFTANVITPDTLDANGYPTSITHSGVVTFITMPSQTDRPGNYCITWDGTGTISVGAGGGVALGSCSFTGSIAATTLTVSTVASGAFVPGQLVIGSGVAAYTIVMAQLSGAAGGAGTYTISVSQSVASIAMTASGGSQSSSGSANAGFFSFNMIGASLTFRITAVGSSSNYISNVKLFHVDDAALILTGKVFGTKFKQRLLEANFGVIRFLNYQVGNTTNVTNWASRKPVGYVYYNGFEYRSALYCTTGATRTVTAYSTNRPSIHSSDGTAWSSGGPKDKDLIHVRFVDSYAATNVTFTSGNPSIAMAAHGLSIGARLHFSLESGGSLPGGITDNTRYYVVSVPDAGHITVSLSPGGTAVTPSSAGTATTIAANPFLTLNVGGAGDIDIISDYSGWMRGSLYPVGSSFSSLVTLVYDATFNAWIRYGMLGGSTPGSIGIDNGVPPELMLQLCAEVGAHPYFIAPPLAIDPMTDYIPSLAAYCRDNAPAWMIPRYEGPNELWNTGAGFFQTGYAQTKSNAYAASDPTHWSPGAYHEWYGKIISTIGQAVATVYSVSMANVKTQTKYQVITGVQTGTLGGAGWTGSSARLASTSYINQTAAAQSPYLKSAASNWVTTVACAQYITPGLYFTNSSHGTPNEADLATAYNSGAGDLSAPGTYEASIAAFPSYGVAGNFTLPAVLVLYTGARDMAQNFGVPKICGYEGSYSPDYVGPTIVDDLRRAGKNVAALQGHTTTNLNNFVSVTNGSVTAEFPSNFIIGGSYTWSTLDPNIYVTTNPPQWSAFIAFNH